MPNNRYEPIRNSSIFRNIWGQCRRSVIGLHVNISIRVILCRMQMPMLKRKATTSIYIRCRFCWQQSTLDFKHREFRRCRWFGSNKSSDLSWTTSRVGNAKRISLRLNAIWKSIRLLSTSNPIFNKYLVLSLNTKYTL